jgi:hypothetical protein
MSGSGEFNNFNRQPLVESGFTTAPRKGKTSAIRAQLIGSSTCSAVGKTAMGPAPVLTLCRQFVAAGLDPNYPLEVYRGGRLALSVRSIGEAAKLTVRESTRDGRPRFAQLSSDGSAPMQNWRPAREEGQTEDRGR